MEAERRSAGVPPAGEPYRGFAYVPMVLKVSGPDVAAVDALGDRAIDAALTALGELEGVELAPEPEAIQAYAEALSAHTGGRKVSVEGLFALRVKGRRSRGNGDSP